MSALDVLKQIDDFHLMIDRGKSNAEVIALYKRFVISEMKELQDAMKVPEIVKEACDVIVVCRPIIRLDRGNQGLVHVAINDSMIAIVKALTGSWIEALYRVNQSNLSKFILCHEIADARGHFESMGINVRIEPINETYFGAYAVEDQNVNGKVYEHDKLLKGPKYCAIDESIEWWKV